MKVKKISIANVEVDALPELLDKEKIGFQPIDNVNWEAYPYRPKVEFRIAHSDDAVLLHFNVKEASVRAKYGEDDGSVWILQRLFLGWFFSLSLPVTVSIITSNATVSEPFLLVQEQNATTVNALLGK